MKHRGIIRLALLSTLASFTGLPPATIKAQQVLRSPENAVVRPTPPAASAATAVPALVPYSGYGTNADGKPITGEVPVTFLLYKDETGGEPVFTESQVAAFDPAGHYEVQLGATLSMFQIASDAPNVKVSWQITGVRHDAYAKAHPLVVEQEKGVHERGLYKHPELYGQPMQKGIEWARHPATTSAKQKQSRLPK